MHMRTHERKWQESNSLSASAVLHSQKRENKILGVHGKFRDQERGFSYPVHGL